MGREYGLARIAGGLKPYSCIVLSQFRLVKLYPSIATRGGRYLLGDYDKKQDKFVVTEGGDFNFGTSAPCDVHAREVAFWGSF